MRACLAAYAAGGERGQLRTDEELSRRLEEHARVIGLLVDYGHRLGLKAWVSRREHDRPYEGATLLDRLQDDERRAYLPLVIRAPAEVLGTVDAMWYRRGRLAFLFEVEWTAMMGEAILRRGREIPPGDQQARFLVFPAERTELVRLKLERSPWLRAEVERQNWHFLKWQHLETLVGLETAGLERMEPVLGLDPLIERGGRAAHDVRGIGRRSVTRRASDRRPLTGSVCSPRECRGSPLRHSRCVPVRPRLSRFRALAPAGRPAHGAAHHRHHLVDVRLPLARSRWRASGSR